MRVLTREILTAVDAAGFTNTRNPPAYYYSMLRIEVDGAVLSAYSRTETGEISNAAQAAVFVDSLERTLLSSILKAAERKRLVYETLGAPA